MSRVPACSLIFLGGSRGIFRDREHFDHNKADNDCCTDQRLFAKGGSRKSKTVVYEVRHRVGHDCRADQGKKKRNCEIVELLHLYAPRAVDMPEDWLDDTGRSVACSRNEGISRLILDRERQEKPVRP